MTEKIKDIGRVEKKYRLIASDMDGTLLDDDRIISQRTLDAIRTAEEAGIAFTISTGRAHCAVLDYIAQLQLKHPLIIFNGSMIVKPDGEILYNCELERDCALRIWNAGQSVDTTMIVWSKGRLYANRVDEEIEKYIDMCKYAEFAVCTDADIARLAEQGVTKMLFVDRPERINRFLSEVSPTLGEGIRYFKSKPIYLEHVNTKVSKGNALIRLSELMGADITETVAFGDEQNDLEMICAAGLGVAMDNAIDAIKDAAGYITASNNDDGVAIVLEKLAEK